MEQNISIFMKENLLMVILLIFIFLAIIIFFIVTSEKEDDKYNKKKGKKGKKSKKNKKYKYSPDDIDDLSLMSSDDMIYCLKKDKTCKKMSFKKCRKNHINTYLSKGNCKKAKKQLEGEQDEETDNVTPGPSIGWNVNTYLRKFRRNNSQN